MVRRRKSHSELECPHSSAQYKLSVLSPPAGISEKQLKRGKDDNPTIGILLCEDTDEDIARYSVLHDNDHLFASKYMLYLPTPEQLRAEIERQKAIFYLKKNEGGIE